MNNGDAPPPYSPGLRPGPGPGPGPGPAPASATPQPNAPRTQVQYNPRDFMTPSQIRGYEREGVLPRASGALPRPSAHARAANWDGRESPNTFLQGETPLDESKTTTTTTSHMSNGDIVVKQKIVTEKVFVFKGAQHGARS